METSLFAAPFAILAVALEVIAIYASQPYSNFFAGCAIVLGLIALGAFVVSVLERRTAK